MKANKAIATLVAGVALVAGSAANATVWATDRTDAGNVIVLFDATIKNAISPAQSDLTAKDKQVLKKPDG